MKIKSLLLTTNLENNSSTRYAQHWIHVIKLWRRIFHFLYPVDFLSRANLWAHFKHMITFSHNSQAKFTANRNKSVSQVNEDSVGEKLCSLNRRLMTKLMHVHRLYMNKRCIHHWYMRKVQKRARYRQNNEWYLQCYREREEKSFQVTFWPGTLDFYELESRG